MRTHLIHHLHPKRLAAWAGPLTALLVLGAAVQAQQPSDDCVNAPLIQFNSLNGISVPGSTIGATLDGACSCASGPTGPDVWFRFVPAVDGGIRAYTNTGSVVADWILSIHTVCPGTVANEIACNDNSPFVPQGGARVEADLIAGHTYWIRVAGANASAGTFYLLVDFPTNTWPLHDDPSRPVAIAPGAHPSDCTGADDAGATGDAWVETLMTAGQRVVVRVTRAGPQSSDQPILLTATFRPGIVLCAGDGSGTACPCGNTGTLGHGCAHSSGAGALLQASGVASVSADTLRLEGSGLPLTAPGMYVQGTALVAGGTGAVFGDGLRCVAGAVIRLGVRSSTNGASAYGDGDGTNASVAQKGLVPASGGTRHYQLWFRDAAQFCTSAAFNLSNALSVQWMP